MKFSYTSKMRGAPKECSGEFDMGPLGFGRASLDWDRHTASGIANQGDGKNGPCQQRTL